MFLYLCNLAFISVQDIAVILSRFSMVKIQDDTKINTRRYKRGVEMHEILAGFGNLDTDSDKTEISKTPCNLSQQ